MEGEDRERFWMERVREIHLQHTREKLGLLSGLKEHFGSPVVDIVARTAAERTRREWQEIAEQSSDRTLQDLVRLLWEPLRAKGFAFTVDWREDGVQLICTRCPVADMARLLGDREWLYHLVCGVDPALVEGFNPELGLRRTRTLMEGHDCCDHFYFVKRSGNESALPMAVCPGSDGLP